MKRDLKKGTLFLKLKISFVKWFIDWKRRRRRIWRKFESGLSVG